MSLEELKQQFRYHFGQLWNMTPSQSVRKVSLCSDSSLQMDYSKHWSEYSIEEQDGCVTSMGHAKMRYPSGHGIDMKKMSTQFTVVEAIDHRLYE